jgi:hypothetical protein
MNKLSHIGLRIISLLQVLLEKRDCIFDANRMWRHEEDQMHCLSDIFGSSFGSIMMSLLAPKEEWLRCIGKKVNGGRYL